MQTQDRQAQSTASSQSERDDFRLRAPALSLPKGGGAVRGIGETFSANPVTGTGAMQVPLALSPGRAGFGPQLALNYDSGAGNGPFGLGWSIGLPSIQRKTDRGLPRYDDARESDVFLLAGAEDLVPVSGPEGEETLRVAGRDYRIRRYRPRIEGLFARIERWTDIAQPRDTFWRTISADNITTWFGRDPDSRIDDPDAPAHVLQWLISYSHDDKGHVMVYRYLREDAQGVDLGSAWEANRAPAARRAHAYPKRILYGNVEPFLPQLDAAQADALPQHWLFEAVFDYGDHSGDGVETIPSPTPDTAWPARPDAFSNHRAGFEIRSYRLCRRVLMFHHMPHAPEVGADCLVRATEFDYAEPPGIAAADRPGYTTLRSVRHRHYQRRGAGYASRELPPLGFAYREPRVDTTVKTLDAAQLRQLPVGTQGPGYRWIDLDGEGLSGVLAEQAGAWYYTPNRGDGEFGPMRAVAAVPSLAANGARHQFMDLSGDGAIDVVEFDGPTPGFHRRDREHGWARHVPFARLPNLNWNDPNLRFIDLTGDGHADALITEDAVFTWYPSLEERGFDTAERRRQPMDENAGPHLVFADGTQSIFLADMCGDGLTDLVRIRHHEVCYWPNLGYGRFGRKITLGGAPQFDTVDRFDPARIRMTDIDGSGPVDIVYLGDAGAQLYFNRSGNALSPPLTVALPVATHHLAAVQVADLLGNGTACLVWNSHLPADAAHPVRYIDLMGGAQTAGEESRYGKPHLLIGIDNHLGLTTRIEYTPSTRFYLQDLQAGTPWVTRLPFPVHCVSKVSVRDRWRKTVFSTCYSYHHGYFDGAEREFRGFGRVEQWDTQAFADVQLANAGSAYVSQDRTLYQPPVKTVRWFHTGAAHDRQRILGAFEHEYFNVRHADLFRTAGFAEPALAQPQTDPGDGPPLDAGEWREAMRACKGMPLRQEVYELDARALEEQGRHVPVRLFSASQHTCRIRRLQARGAHRHAVFIPLESETSTCHYELDMRAAPADVARSIDPRIAHTMTLRFDAYGRALQTVAVVYPRHRPLTDAALPAQTQALIREVQAERHIAYTEARFTDELDSAHRRLHHRLPLPCETLTYELSGSDAATGFAPSRGVYFAPEDFLRFALSERLPGQGQAPVVALAYHQQAQHGAAHRRLVQHTRSLYWNDSAADAAPHAALPFGQHGPRGLKYEDYTLALTDGLLAAVFGVDSGAASVPPADRLAWEAVPAANGRPAQTCRDLLNAPSISGYVRGTALGLGADQYWLRSGTAGFESDAHAHFFLPERLTDAFGHNRRLAYDALDLYVASSTDAAGNTVRIDAFDFRVLAPTRMRDAHGNVSVVAFDTLGLPVAAAALGKVQAGANGAPEITQSGNRLDAFDFDGLNPAPGEIAEFFAPADPAAALDLERARAWLGKAGARFVYHFGEIRDAQGRVLQWAATAAGACSLVRERHEADLPNLPNQAIPLQIAFEYSDGSGQSFVKKNQAEPSASGGPLRWIANGKTIVNNKGKPVLQYEPYFSDSGHRFAEPQAQGVSPVMFYDAPGRLVRSEMPDGTFNRVEFSPWFVRSFDANDTVLQSAWYRQKGRDSLPPDQPLPMALAPLTPEITPDQRAGWLAAQHANTPTHTHLDSLGREVIAIAHQRAPDDTGAWRDDTYATFTRLDAEGKPLWIRDARGNTVMQYMLPRKPTRWADEAHERMPGNAAPCYDIAGNSLYQFSMDSGERWQLNDAAGQALCAWDFNERQHDDGSVFEEHRLYVSEYDALHRPVAQWLSVWQRPKPTQPAVQPALAFQTAPRAMLERFEYQDGAANDPDNLNGQLVRHYDASGMSRTVRRNFDGTIVHSERRHAADAKTALIDWQAPLAPNDARLEAEVYRQIAEHDALGRMRLLYHWHRDLTFAANGAAQETPGQTNRVAVYEPTYNERGLLQSERLHVRASKTTAADGRVSFVADPARSARAIAQIAYNAKGQKTWLALGNGAVTQYSYDAQTFRLTRLYTRRDARFTGDCENPQPPPDTIAAPVAPPPGKRCGLQWLDYVYDAVGNIVHLRDNAQPTVYFKNRTVAPSCDYVYDALYRLIEASGREHDAHSGSPSLPESGWSPRAVPSDEQLRRYTQRYAYDSVGNLEQLRHSADGGGWTRYYAMAADSNRLLRTWEGDADWNAAPASRKVEYGHDTHGSMRNLLQSAPQHDLRWDHRDMIRQIDLGGGGQAWYQYDSQKQRTRKFIARSGGVTEERLYLAGYERYRRTLNGQVVEEIESFHLFEGEQRVLLVDDVLEAREQPGPNGLQLEERTCWRYQFGNHLGSVALELDEHSQVISYEEYHPYGTSAYRLMSDAMKVPAKRYRFTGMERDEESGLNYHGARYYLSALGRWASKDPAGIQAGYNGYSYVSGNVIKLIDRLGLDEDDAEQAPKKNIDNTRYFESQRIFSETVSKTLPSEPLPTTARQKSVDVDIETTSHDEAVVAIINAAIEAAAEKARAEGVTLTQYELLRTALFDYVIPYRNKSAQNSQNLVLRDVDHYFVGRIQEWRRALPWAIFKESPGPTKSAQTIYEGEIASEKYDLNKRESFSSSQNPDQENAKSSEDQNSKPASAPGGRMWAWLGGKHLLDRDSPEDPAKTSDLKITVEDVRKGREQYRENLKKRAYIESLKRQAYGF
jgi:RHS repeat-associated protein